MGFSIPKRTLSRLRSLDKTAFSADVDIHTYTIHFNVTATNRDGKDDLDAYLALTSVTSPSFLSITSDYVRLSRNDDDFSRSISAHVWDAERILSALNDNTILFLFVDRIQQVIIFQFLVPRVLGLSNHARMAEHSGERRL